jgi:hypothetical protein
MGSAAYEVMFLAFAIIAFTAGAVVIIANSLRKAPVGYEDEHGFHIIRQTKGSAILLRQKSTREANAGALKGARVNT